MARRWTESEFAAIVVEMIPQDQLDGWNLGGLHAVAEQGRLWQGLLILLPTPGMTNVQSLRARGPSGLAALEAQPQTVPVGKRTAEEVR